MNAAEAIEKVRGLADSELLAGLHAALGSSRKLVAWVLAHLAEVEERRIHLLAGYTSLFAYCTLRLAMSEDEAYRRIRVARLARRFPTVLERLAGGELSLSVAALLEPHLTEENHAELLGAAAHKTIAQAREVLAAWFPKPDVLPFIRKLPQRATAVTAGERTAPGDDDRAATCNTASTATTPATNHPIHTPSSDAISGHESGHSSNGSLPGLGGAAVNASATLPSQQHASTSAGAAPEAQIHPARPNGSAASAAARANRASSSVEPLSPGRYKVAFTASAELKRKLDLARDLSSHAVPGADLAAIIERALDLLIDKALRRRFAKTTRRKAKSPEPPGARTATAKNPEPGTAGVTPTPSTVAEAEPLGGHEAACAAGTAAVDARANAAAKPDAFAAAKPDASSAAAKPDAFAAATPNAASAAATPNAASAAAKPDASSAAAKSDAFAAATPNAASAAAKPNGASAAAKPDASSAAAKPDAASAAAKPNAANAPPPPPRSRHLPSATRRAVLERDGLRCTWVSPDGTRCESRAWLEHDHITPRGQGGSDEPENIRIRCRAHNQLAAEQAYGQQTIARAIAHRRGNRQRRDARVDRAPLS